MNTIRLKAIQLKSWISGSIRSDDGKFCSSKTFFFLAKLYGAFQFGVLLLRMVVWILKILYYILPYGIHFIEGLISTLSYYKNKKEFFYGF